MRSGMALSGMGCLALWVAASHGVAGADEIVVDSHRVRDWARVMTSYAWKDQDSILQPAALLQFDSPAS